VSGEIERPLREVTSARLSLGTSGEAVSTRESLRFQMDHALARDAVHAAMDGALLVRGMKERGWESLVLRSAVTGGRQEYLRRPDLGRRLAVESREMLREAASALAAEVVFVVADGLSALAAERHALGLMDALRERLKDWTVGPVCVVTQGRVAVGDEIGEVLGAKVVVMLIGERPGLSAADSLGVYVTWEPRVGRTDAERNCVSNVRDGGLGYVEAAERVVGLMCGAKALGATGVGLKDGDGLGLLG
jgi:ethanolamine ammonia-lyase small subunit